MNALSIAVCNPPIEKALVIAPESVHAKFSGQCFLPFGASAPCYHCVHDQAIADSSWVLLIAPELDFLIQITNQIRSCSQTALVPLVACADQSHQEINPLVDVFLPFPPDNHQINPIQDRLIRLIQNTQAFKLVPAIVEGREERWLNLLRYMYSRDNLALIPQWNIAAKYGYSYPLAGGIFREDAGKEIPQLELLAKMGLLEETFFDKIHLCPKCGHYQLNFREVCPICRKSQIYWVENVHHYMCGHIAPRPDFAQFGGLVCPKCRQELLHLGVDYEKPSSGYYCPACRKPFTEPLVDCRCLNCAATDSIDKIQPQTIQQYQLSPLGVQAALSGQLSSAKLKELLYRQAGVLDYDLFKRLLEIEISLAKRYPRPLSLIKLEITNYPVAENDELFKYRFWGDLMGAIRKNLRVNDLVTWRGGESLLILSLGANVNKMKEAVCRMQKNVAKDWPGITLSPTFIPLNPNQNWELLLREIGGQGN